MKPQLSYIELKTGYSDNGPAWIGFVEYSKTGQTVYFNDKAFGKRKGSGVSGNYFDVETREEYWVSGVKKNGQDRHRTGNGKLMIDKACIEPYLSFVNQKELDLGKFIIFESVRIDKNRIREIQNTPLLPSDNKVC